MHKSATIITVLLFAVSAAIVAPAATIVQWGSSATIVGGFENLVEGEGDSTLNLSTPSNPAIGASYYNANTGRSPLFYANAVVNSGDDSQVNAFRTRDGVDSVQASFSDDDDTTLDGSSLYVWTQTGTGSQYGFLNDGDSGQVTLTSLSIDIDANAAPGGLDELRWVIRLGSTWYISSDDGTLDNNYTTQTANLGSVSWLGYDPVTDITSIGVAASPGTLSGLTAVGVYMNGSRGSATQNSMNWDFSNFTAGGDVVFIPEPSSLAMMLCGAIAVLYRRRLVRA